MANGTILIFKLLRPPFDHSHTCEYLVSMADTDNKQDKVQQQQQHTGASEQKNTADLLDTFLQRLPAILKEADHHECWGVDLTNTQAEATRMIVHKWLNSTTGDLEQACTNLTAALKWRKDFKPLECMDMVHDSKFDGLGYITRNDIKSSSAVVTWSVFFLLSLRSLADSTMLGTFTVLQKTMARSLATLSTRQPLSSFGLGIASFGVYLFFSLFGPQVPQMARRSHGASIARAQSQGRKGFRGLRRPVQDLSGMSITCMPLGFISAHLIPLLGRQQIHDYVCATLCLEYRCAR